MTKPSNTLNQAAHSSKATEDEKLLKSPIAEPIPFTQTDTWRVMRIMGEFVEGFEALAELGPAVTIFGSARVKPGDVRDYILRCHKDASILAQPETSAREAIKKVFAPLRPGDLA